MAQNIITDYTLNAAAGTVTLNGIATVELPRLIRIYNITRNETVHELGSRNTVASLSGSVITLDQVGRSAIGADTDVLQIFYDEPVTGGGGGGGGGAVTIADGADVAQGARNQTAATGDTGTWSLIQLVKRGLERLTTIISFLAPRSTDTGLQVFRNVAATNAALAVKASAGNVYGLRVTNPNPNAIFVKFYNLAQGSTTVGTSPVRGSVMVPGGTAQNPGMLWVAPSNIPMFAFYGTAITVAVTQNQADNDNTAPAAAVSLNVIFV